MKQAVEFEECLKDSPRFRLQIDQNEHDINVLEGALEKVSSPVVVGKISKMVDIEANFMEGTEKVGLRQDT